jgi:ABC-type Zn uptake system ZnuABC Zn-binding protein ZnuA
MGHRMHRSFAGPLFPFGLAAVLSLGLLAPSVAAEPLRVCATIPELGSLADEIGGDHVDVTVFAKPTEDPHFVDARPSFIKAMNRADLFLLNGLDLEIGWAPVLVQNSRNPRIQPGSPGYVDASQVIEPIGTPPGTLDRAMGDVHPHGNPHYLLDPINGLKVAALLRDKMSALRPADAGDFSRRLDDFERRLSAKLAGAKLAAAYDVEKLAILQQHGKLLSFLRQQGQESDLEGWWKTLLGGTQIKAVEDHRLWPYFARRFGIEIVAEMEPKPGIPPTTKHLRIVVEKMRAQDVRLILASAYYDPRHAEFLAREAGAFVARLANHVGARPGTYTYIEMFSYNVAQIAASRGGRPTTVPLE